MAVCRNNKRLVLGNLCLPDEIVFEILKRVPAKFLLRFKCVSKFFCSLISDPSFVEAHLKSSVLHSRVICCVSTANKQDIIYDVNERIDQELARDVVQYLDARCIGSNFQHMESVNGIVCLWNNVGDVSICNPFTKQRIVLPKPREEVIKTCCYLGFDPTTKKHKILKVSTDRNCEIISWIFTIGYDKSWRDIPPNAKISSHTLCGHAHIDGVIYCINELERNIIAFSVGDEKVIRTIPFPDMESTILGVMRQRITVIKGQVALPERLSSKVLLYILNGTERWVKHTIELPSIIEKTTSMPLITTNWRGEIVMISGNKNLPMFIYDIRRKEWITDVQKYQTYDEFRRKKWRIDDQEHQGYIVFRRTEWRRDDQKHQVYKRQYRACSSKELVDIVESLWSVT